MDDDEENDAEESDPSSGGSILRPIAEIPKHAPPSQSAVQTGTSIGRFRVLGLIGAGGMGVVYKATDEKLRRTVALKVLPPLYADNQERRRRFLREARSAAAVTHANIATIHEVDEADGRIYIVMEYVEGRTLRSILTKGPLPVPEAIRIAHAVASGLVKAHDKGIVHRDLKPDNVMLGADGEVKILDFGLAKLRQEKPDLEPGEPAPDLTQSGELPGTRSDLSSERALGASLDGLHVTSSSPDLEHADTLLMDQAGQVSGADGSMSSGSAETHLTRAGQVLGTPGYMSPEQATGTSVDARSDIFSLGVVLYEMLSGTRPFKGETNADVLRAVKNDPPWPLVKYSVSPELSRIAERCLAKEPKARYGTARELLGALDAIVGKSGSDLPPAIQRTSTTTSKRRASLVVGLGIVFLGGTTFVGKYSPGPSPTPSPSGNPTSVGRVPIPPSREGGGVMLDAGRFNPPVKSPPSAFSPAPPITKKIPRPPSPVPSVITTGSSTPSPAPKPQCDPPYTIDDRGHLIPKLECL